ncbi:hypothetical protein B0G76_8436 [Paraburkholderia sp. BL23I1N1]|uniref:hypothetical protein n=1 Tax=Paraburkholderia sp. BL23I1N1 TaxID=1938802 RepID=UPI000E72631B|nr:hypothetical protein [Paraburkholderia sp. BL23I1N1]RKE23755.1 hypothetical protein B0G76_8436 [Paraburkholderia sp. BL23I1N1]
MEHRVRVRNESDRRTLAWLRERTSDAALATTAQACMTPGQLGKAYVSQLCRRLGLRPPWQVREAATGAAAHSEVGDRHLAAIRQILARPQVETRRPAG